MADPNDLVTIFGGELTKVPSAAADTLGLGRVPIDAIRANLAVVLGHVQSLADTARHTLTGARVASMDVELALGVDGSVGFLGSGVSTSVTGTFTFHVEL